MKNNSIALELTKKAFLDDRLCLNSGLANLLECEILSALSPYIEIDKTNSKIDIDITKNGLVIDCKIRALTIKRFGLNY